MCGASEDAIVFGVSVGEVGEMMGSFEEGVEGYLGGEGFLVVSLGIEVDGIGLHTGDTRGLSSWAMDRARKVNGTRRGFIMSLYA